MRIYRSQVTRIANDVIATLRKNNDIEVLTEKAAEAERDLVAVLDEYLKKEHQISEEAKDLIDSRRLLHSDVGRIKRELAERYGHIAGEEGIRWLAGQCGEMLMASRNVEEVFADDVQLRRKVLEVFKRHLIDEDRLDKEARERIKNLKEGTSEWTIQYQKVMREVRKKYGLS